MNKIVLFILLLFAVQTAKSTHNRAGEIVYEHLSGFTFNIKVITYTIDSSSADRPELELNFGDGTSSLVERSLIYVISNGLQYNEYKTSHTFPGPAIYVISMTDPNLIDNIINIDGGESVNTTFYLEDTLKLLDVDFYGYNSSPVLLQAPIDYANINEIFVHNPNAFDPNGDSLTYQLITPLSEAGILVPNYQTLTQVGVSPSNTMTLNTITGELIWDSPQVQGIYSIEYLIREFRFGVCIGTQIRHMQIVVESHQNTPPIIAPVFDTCVIAGSTLNLVFFAKDSDTPDQLIEMFATGGPLLVDSSNAFYTSTIDTAPQLNFTWNTSCNSIRKANYQLVIKATDNYTTTTGELKPLSDLATWNIRVLAPPVSNVVATIISNKAIKLDWDSAYSCSSNAKFLYFSIWRKIDCAPIGFDCDNDPSQLGYTLLKSTYFEYNFIDSTLLQGHQYSYIVIAHFGTTNAFGVIHNKFSSAISIEACVALPFLLPIITNVSVDSTSSATGAMYVAWSKPQIPALDTLVYTPPYQYNLSYKTENTPFFLPLFSITKPTFFQCNDTTFVHHTINTQDTTFVYKLEFISAAVNVGSSEATSIFLTTSAGDNKAKLIWDIDTPWRNDQYVIYRKNIMGLFDSIATTTTTTYIDEPLINGREYCYKIKSIGKYTLAGPIRPIINYSQEQCLIPIDNEAPCGVTIEAANDCSARVVNASSYSNYLNWIYEGSNCVNDIVGYEIYFVPQSNNDTVLITAITNPSVTVYQHIIDTAVTGCYFIQSIDSVGNKSGIVNFSCVSNCIEYELPNTFTPNADQQNDYFIPRVIRYVDYVECSIYNQWGVEVYQTNDPFIQWNGYTNKKETPTAVYYYVCKVYGVGDRAKPIKTLKGYIDLQR